MHSDENDFPIRQQLFVATPTLRERAASFWDDDERQYIELVVLAKRAGCLWERESGRLLAGLRSAVASGVGAETFDSEPPETVSAMRRRLDRLRCEPELAEAWLDFMTDVAAAVDPVLDSEGCVAVEMSVRSLTPVAARSNTWPDVVQEPGCEWPGLLPRLGPQTIAAGGEVVVVPAWLARKSFLLSFGDLVLIGVPAPRQPVPSEATRTLARRLRALADPTRLALVEQLAIRPRGVGELARELQVSQPTVSNHVRLLREAGVVEEGSRPKNRQLQVVPDGVDRLLAEVRSLVLGAK